MSIMVGQRRSSIALVALSVVELLAPSGSRAQAVAFRLVSVDGHPLPVPDTAVLERGPTLVGQTLSQVLTFVGPNTVRSENRYLSLWPYTPCSALRALNSARGDSGAAGILVPLDPADTVTAGCDDLRTELISNRGTYTRSRDSLVIRMDDDTTTIRGVWRADTIVVAYAGRRGTYVRLRN